MTPTERPDARVEKWTKALAGLFPRPANYATMRSPALVLMALADSEAADCSDATLGCRVAQTWEHWVNEARARTREVEAENATLREDYSRLLSRWDDLREAHHPGIGHVCGYPTCPLKSSDTAVNLHPRKWRG